MATKTTFNNKDFSVIGDDDIRYIVYVLDDFLESNIYTFRTKEDTAYFLKIGIVKLPCDTFGFGFQSNILNYDNRPVNGGLLEIFKTELDALIGAFKMIERGGVTNNFYGREIMKNLEDYINPKSLF